MVDRPSDGSRNTPNTVNSEYYYVHNKTLKVRNLHFYLFFEKVLVFTTSLQKVPLLDPIHNFCCCYFSLS